MSGVALDLALCAAIAIPGLLLIWLVARACWRAMDAEDRREEARKATLAGLTPEQRAAYKAFQSMEQMTGCYGAADDYLREVADV